jgi:uncharacterized membrane protein YkoI
MRGNALPLAKVLSTVQAKVDGDVLDVTLKQLASGALVYDVTILSSKGEYRSIVIDAKRNQIIGTGQH